MSLGERNLSEVFFEDTYNVEKCLSGVTDLESLRDELKTFATSLQQQMAEILKKETETIIDFGEHLTSLDRKIEDLYSPLSQLREDIKSLFEIMKNSKLDFASNLTKLKNTNKSMSDLNLTKSILFSCVYIDNVMKTNLINDMSVLERTVIKFSSERHYLVLLHAIPSDIKIYLERIEGRLLEETHMKFLEAIQKEDRQAVQKCLEIYDNLNKYSEAERIFQTKVVRTGLRQILCEENLIKHGQDIDKVYNEVIQFMEKSLKDVSAVLQEKPELQFDFILRSFWPEVSKQCKEGLSYIATPGSPDLFQKRYKSSWKFCIEVARRCHDPAVVKTEQTFVEFIKLFELPVYFEIRYQQICSSFEKALLVTAEDVYEKTVTDDCLCKLKPTSALIESFKTSLSDTVFLEQLSDQFLKLMLLMLSRYLKWTDEFMNKLMLPSNCDKLLVERFIICLLKDLTILVSTIGDSTHPSTNNANKSLYKAFPDVLKPEVLEVIAINKSFIEKHNSKVITRLTKLKVDDIVDDLDKVGDIPRLYRKTNKSAPSSPSLYVVKAVDKLQTFNASFKEVLGDDFFQVVINIMIDITLRYSKLVEHVVKSVCKIEESLRRLKQRNQGTNDDSTSATSLDEMKIRMQITLDVRYFKTKVTQWNQANDPSFTEALLHLETVSNIEK